MSKVTENDQVLAGEYALGLLDASEVTLIEARLRGEPDLRDAYATWAEDFALMNDAGEAPPPALKARIDNEIFGPQRRSFTWLWGMGGVVAAALAVVAYLNISEPEPDYFAEISQENLTITAEVFVDDQRMVLPVLMSQPPENSDHELWLIPLDGTPISLGVLASGEIQLPENVDLSGAVIAVTVEAVGGSAIGAPTSQPIAVVPLTAL